MKKNTLFDATWQWLDRKAGDGSRRLARTTSRRSFLGRASC